MGAGRECRFSGARRGIGCKKGALGLIGMLGAIRGQRGSQRYQGCQGCIGVASGLGAQPHWAPVQGPRIPTGSLGE